MIAIGGLRKEWVGIGNIKDGEGCGGGGVSLVFRKFKLVFDNSV